MNVAYISYRNIVSRPLSAWLNILLFATGIFIISFLLSLKGQYEDQLEKNVAGVDMVVGAKGSPLQLILSGIYHIDYPTGNISLEEAERLSKHPLVKQTIPMALGDNVQGFRIVGTTHEYAALYGAKLRTGFLWENDSEVCIGARVAEQTGMKPGDTFVGVHGLAGESGHSHDDFKYQVAGIFEPTGTVLDQLVLTNISSVWAVHHHSADAPREITSMLLFYKNPMGAIQLGRYINSKTNMQAASPAMELNRLFSLLGSSIQSVSMIAWLIIIISAFSVFISLSNSLKERRYELALIRVMGGGKPAVFSLLVLEGLLLAFFGCLLGLLFARCGMWLVSTYTESNYHYAFNVWGNLSDDLSLLGFSLLLGLLASLIPAVKAMGTNISKVLSK